MGSKAREGAEAMSLAFVLLDFRTLKYQFVTFAFMSSLVSLLVVSLLVLDCICFCGRWGGAP